MRNIVLAFMLFFLSGCSVNNLLLSEEIDTIHIVKYQKYFKQHRAYFKRDNLQLVTPNSKYLFLYHAKKHAIGILLERQNTYILYNFTKEGSANITLSPKKKMSYKNVLNKFSHIGYRPANMTKLGYSAKVAFRQYKGIKTRMVEIKDYRNLKQRYEKAIRTYQSNGIMSIKTHLPKKFIYSYFKYYQAQATTPKQLEQLQHIATKLRLHEKTIVIEEEESDGNIFSLHIDNAKGYDYYLHRASINELRRYLTKSDTKDSLSDSEYKILKTQLISMKEEALFNDGSLEELIEAYKVNKNPNYKERIMTLMKEAQEKQ